MGDWPIGISTGSFWRAPFASCLAPIREAGFSLIEVCSAPGHLDYHDREACERAAAEMRRLDLEPYSFHAPFAPEIDISAPEELARARARHEILSAAEAAARLGVRYFVLHPGPEAAHAPRGERLDRMERSAEVLNQVARRCRELGVGLVLENMLPHLFAGHVRDLLWLLGALEGTDVGICLDTGHAFLSSDLRGVAHKLSGHLWMLHASDNRGRFDDHLPPGEGAVPWPELLRQLDESGFAGAVVLELAAQEDWQDGLRRAQHARSYLRGLAAGSAAGRPSPAG